MIDAKLTCPCGSDETYGNCCQRFHQSKMRAKTAEQLMRSRYSAYSFKLIDYLFNTTHPDKRTATLHQEISAWADQADFF